MAHFGFRAASPLILGVWELAVPFRFVRSIYASGSVQDCNILFNCFSHQIIRIHSLFLVS